ncbi:MAG: glycosyltransferase family 2 protein [Spirochaetaceae bacterium]
MEPMVSVVIPTYERKELLGIAVASVLAQGFREFELIVVDDASRDGSREYLDSLREVDSRLRPVYLEEHLGFPGAVRNRGVEIARGSLIAFLDSDDRWLEEKLELQVPLHGKGGFRITHTRERWLRKGREISQKGQTHRREGDIFTDALGKCIIGPSTAMVDRRLLEELGGFDEELEVAEDYELWLRVTAREAVGYLEVPLTEKHAGHGDQLSEKYGQIEGFRIEALRRLLSRDALPRERRQEAVAALAGKLEIFASGARKRGRLREADSLEAEARQLREGEVFQGETT